MTAAVHQEWPTAVRRECRTTCSRSFLGAVADVHLPVADKSTSLSLLDSAKDSRFKVIDQGFPLSGDQSLKAESGSLLNSVEKLTLVCEASRSRRDRRNDRD